MSEEIVIEKITLEFIRSQAYMSDGDWERTLQHNQHYLTEVHENIDLKLEHKSSLQQSAYADSLGWLHVDEWANASMIQQISDYADHVKEDADVFVLIGVGGSNQGARAVIKAFQEPGTPEILYAGHTISAHYMNDLIKKIKGKSVYINVIAKNFETLEPGIAFSVLRDYLYEVYGEEAHKRIAVTGTSGSSLHALAEQHQYKFFVFPENIGGRFSVLSDVGLYPMAVAGIDIAAIVQGARDMEKHLHEEKVDNIALRYATYRHVLDAKGFKMEMLSFFEPQFSYFSKWWIQLFAESEGKEGKGIFPIAGNYSEDLHSVGQYVQQGQRIIFETFLDIQKRNSSLILQNDEVNDGFQYLNGKDYWDINKTALNATIKAHSEDNIPIIIINVPESNAYYFGQLFYFFEFSCYLSGRILGVNPFDQPGVENYKRLMFKNLGKNM